MASVVEIVEALEQWSPQQEQQQEEVLTVPELGRALGACRSAGCLAVLGAPPAVPPAPAALSPEQWLLLGQLLQQRAPLAPERGLLLAPDGSSVALAPLLLGMEVGLKRAAGWPGPDLQPPLDPLYAVTIAEALGTSFLLAHGAEGNQTTLGPDSCWDDVDDPQNYTLLGPPSLIPDAVANGAMDGVLLGAQLAQGPIPLGDLLRSYYGTGNRTQERRPPSSYRRRAFRVLAGPGKLEEEVLAMLKLLRVLPPTQELLEKVGPEEVVAIAQQAARDFTELYVECPPIVPRCMWGAQPYRGTPKPLTLPLSSIFIHHTLEPSSPCLSFPSCAHALRSIQRFHQDVRRWDDIGYSFVVGSDGYLYQGRGWRWVGAHTKGHNTRGYGVGYVGDFSTTLPDPEVISLVRDQFLPCAVRTGKLQPNYTLRGHRQMGHTECPGNALFQEIKSWHGFQ